MCVAYALGSEGLVYWDNGKENGNHNLRLRVSGYSHP